jgi:hypothetical protein
LSGVVILHLRPCRSVSVLVSRSDLRPPGTA